MLRVTNAVSPAGYWNCRHANIEGQRPRKWVPGTEYLAGCNAPHRDYPGVVTTVRMTEENSDLPICQWHTEEGGE